MFWSRTKHQTASVQRQISGTQHSSLVTQHSSLSTQHSALSTRHFGLLLPAFVVVVSLASLLLLVQMSGVTATSYDVRRLEEVRADWQQMNYQLELYVASLQSLDRIEREARGRLGVVPASTIKFARVDRISPPPPEHLPPAHAKQSVPASPALAWQEQMRRAIEELRLRLAGSGQSALSAR